MRVIPCTSLVSADIPSLHICQICNTLFFSFNSILYGTMWFSYWFLIMSLKYFRYKRAKGPLLWGAEMRRLIFGPAAADSIFAGSHLPWKSRW